MTIKLGKFKKLLERMIKYVRKNPAVFVIALLLIIMVIAYNITMSNRKLEVDSASCKPLLELIAQAESRGNYNAYFGNVSNSELEFTKMSISEVLNLQQKFVAEGSPSSAVGKYQIINSTLSGLVDELEIDKSQAFDEPMQDKFAIALLKRRGARALVNGDMSKEQFASEIAKEWAGLPRISGANPEQSYYDGDGLNKSLVGSKEVLQAVEEIQPE